MTVADYALALAFDTDEPEFARGVELGRLWETLKAQPDEKITQTIHAANAEMALRVGEALQRAVSAVEHDDVWMSVTYSPTEA